MIASITYCSGQIGAAIASDSYCSKLLDQRYCYYSLLSLFCYYLSAFQLLQCLLGYVPAHG
jgi:hypothetical protein